MNCSRCGRTLLEPITEHANYVTHTDFAEEEEREVHYALIHTTYTRERVQELSDEADRDFHAIAAEMARPDAPDVKALTVGTERRENDDGTFVETAKQREMDFSIPVEKFDLEEVSSPEAVKRDDVAYVITEMEPREVQKTGLVCEGCVKDDDEIIWGPASE